MGFHSELELPLGLCLLVEVTCPALGSVCRRENESPGYCFRVPAAMGRKVILERLSIFD